MDRVWQLAADCAGTNVAVIAAENLGWVAEEWWSRSPDGRFNLEVLNMTGILSRPLLEQRMRLFPLGARYRPMREAVINAIIHPDFASPATIQF